MHTSTHTYYHNNLELKGHLAYNNTHQSPRPAVLVVHDWSGCNTFACEKAELMAQLGYVGFAVDMYGHQQVGETDAEKQALMQPLSQDRGLLLERIQAALNTVITMPEVDANRIAVIGFCFGGLCALDLARSGAKIVGAVSFHGLLHKPPHPSSTPITAKILALHGYDDPMARPEQLLDFCNEMTTSGADWQVHMYGKTQHAFTNPRAHNTEHGLIYNPTATHRAMQAMTNFLVDIF